MIIPLPKKRKCKIMQTLRNHQYHQPSKQDYNTSNLFNRLVEKAELAVKQADLGPGEKKIVNLKFKTDHSQISVSSKKPYPQFYRLYEGSI